LLHKSFTLCHAILCYQMTFHGHIGTLPVFRFEKHVTLRRTNGKEERLRMIFTGWGLQGLKWQNTLAQRDKKLNSQIIEWNSLFANQSKPRILV
jgi:hypothetical protein